jgi:hypothetical protein
MNRRDLRSDDNRKERALEDIENTRRARQKHLMKYKAIRGQQNAMRSKYTENPLAYRSKLGSLNSVHNLATQIQHSARAHERQKNLVGNITNNLAVEKIIRNCQSFTENKYYKQSMARLKKYIIRDIIEKTAKRRLQEAILNDFEKDVLKDRIGTKKIFYGN